MIYFIRNKCEVTYLRRNVRTLNAPVCYVPSAQEGEHWWPGRVPSLTKPAPPKTNDSTMRADYGWSEEHKAYGSSRHKHNVAKPALGAGLLSLSKYLTMNFRMFCTNGIFTQKILLVWYVTCNVDS